MAERLPVARVIQTRNLDIAGLLRRLDRGLVEITKSQSSGVSGTLPFDFARIKSFQVGWLNYAVNFAAKEPFADTPESTPVEIAVVCYGTTPPIENDSGWDMAQLIDTMMLELAGSQSSNIGNGFLPPHDLKRFVDLNGRLSNLIAHSEKIDPLDYPESSPRADSTGQGVTGINTTSATR
jgi:hypothetical protein